MRVRPGLRDRLRCLTRVGGLRVEQLDDPARAIRVVERELALEAGADDRHVVVQLTCGSGHGVEVEQAPEHDVVGARRGLQDRPRPVRGREDDRLAARLAEELPRRRADVEAVDPHRVPLAAEDRVPERLLERERLVDLTAAVDPLVPRRERLRDGRGRAQDVDHDSDGRALRLGRRKGDVDAHPRTTLPRWPPRRPSCTATGTLGGRRASPARSAGGPSAPTAWSSRRSGSAARTTQGRHRGPRG